MEITCPEAVLPLFAIIRWMKVCLIKDYEKGDRVILEVFSHHFRSGDYLGRKHFIDSYHFQNTYALGVHLQSID
jgi:hypothetical protein